VRSVRNGTRVRQELVASLGRRDRLVATGQLDQLLQALARFSTRLRVVEAAKDERVVAREAKSWGPALVFGRLWERQGLPALLGRLAAGRRFGFDPERVAAGTGLGPRSPTRRPPLRAGLAAAVRAGLGPAGRRLGADGRGARLRRPGAAPLLPHPCHGGRRSATSSSASSSFKAAICSRASSTWCSSTPLRSTSTATSRARWSAMATAAIVAPTCHSWCCDCPVRAGLGPRSPTRPGNRSTARAGPWPSTSCPATPPMSRRSA